MLTNQELFDKAYAGLKAQGFARAIITAITQSGNVAQCRYRGDDNKRCAVGHCIPEDKYDENMEGARGARLLYRLEIITEDQFEFVDGLQRAHDNSTLPEMMQDRLRALAFEYDLTLPA